MTVFRAFSCALACIALAFFALPADAQRTRFPGDSPTRPSVMNGKVLGTPSKKRPEVPTFTIPQRPSYGLPCYTPYRLPRCGGGIGYPLTYGPYYRSYRYVDYRNVYGLHAPVGVNNNPNPAWLALNRGPLKPRGDEPRVKQRVNDDSLKRAWRYIDLGDRYLREGRLLDARSRYRKARKAAPDLADAYFREMLLELAQRNYTKAAFALENGLKLDPAWAKSKFQLKTVYSDAAQQGVKLLLADKVKDSPNNADTRLLYGVVLHLLGEDAAAKAEFERAMKLSQGTSDAKLFLPAPEVQADVPGLKN